MMQSHTSSSRKTQFVMQVLDKPGIQYYAKYTVYFMNTIFETMKAHIKQHPHNHGDGQSILDRRMNVTISTVHTVMRG